jgi:hypothetical protein
MDIQDFNYKENTYKDLGLMVLMGKIVNQTFMDVVSKYLMELDYEVFALGYMVLLFVLVIFVLSFNLISISCF